MSAFDLSGSLCLVSGGAGFLGQHLTRALLARGARVRVLDRIALEQADVESLTGDLADASMAAAACRGADVVFHAASILAMHHHAPDAVHQSVARTNVEGSAVLVRAAAEAGVRRFVFTSSNHVVLGDAPIMNGDERLPYADGSPDLYTRSKIAAERLVLAAHDAAGLMTCALRPGGLYGPGDRRFVPRVVATARLLRHSVAWGPRSALVDLTHIANLVHANLLAAERLSAAAPGGQAYFISDGDPIRLHDFNRLLLAELGYELPSLRLPTRALGGLIGAWERVWARVGWPRPPFGACEVKTVGLAHWFSLERARRDLGYEPLFNAARGIRQTVAAMRAQAA